MSGAVEGGVMTRVPLAAVTILLLSVISVEREAPVDAQGACFVTLTAGSVQGANLGTTCACDWTS
jgi:hypothetical protein